MTDTLIDIDAIELAHGNHKARDDGMCMMEAVAYFAGEPHTDHPKCACPVLGAFMRSWNDGLPHDERQQLKKYVPLLVGTKGSKKLENRRAWMAADWLVREYTPAWLRLAGLTAQADLLASLHELKSASDVQPIKPALEAIRSDGAAAGAAAGDAAWAAARAAAGAAAWDAAWAAAGAAAGDAAWAAATKKLDPTKRQLQESAHRLVMRMIEATV